MIALLTPIDPNLTLTRTQWPAIVSNTGNSKPLSYAGFANPLQRSVTTDRTLVAGAGQRFESARRLSIFPLDKPNTRDKSIAGRRDGASLHHPYITEAGVKMIHNLLARNVCRNV